MTRKYNIQIFDQIIFFKYRTRQVKTAEPNKKVSYVNLNGSLSKILILLLLL